MHLNNNYIHIFTDGASLVHKNKLSGWGAVLLYKDLIKEICGVEPNSTNNKMELKACIKALEQIKTNHIPIKIYSDSTYVVNGMNEWIYNWQLNGWKSNKQKIKNKELWEELYSLSQKQDDVEFVKVKGHAGIKWNERADELCTNAIDEYKQDKEKKT